jgi:nicotinamide-nucleotide amidase
MSPAVRRQSGATHALAVSSTSTRARTGSSSAGRSASRSPPRRRESRRSRIVGGREWVRLGAVEMGLDCLRRQLQGLPVYERIDFEKA